MHPQLLSVKEIISKVRARLRMRRLSLGLLLTLAVAVVGFLAAAFLAYRYQQKHGLLVVLRILPFLLTLGAAVWFLLKPLRDRLHDTKIARLIEERVNLGDRVTTAVEFAEDSRDASPAILNRLVKDADARIAGANLNQIVDPRYTYAYSAGAALLVLALVASMWLFTPVSRGLSALYSPFEKSALANAMFIEVTPTSGKVPRGSDQRIKATLNGFDASGAQVFMRKLSDANWLATPMEPAKNQNEFQFNVFNIQDSVVYYVEANGIRSPEQTLEVVDLPYVKQIDLVLNFPGYTGLAAKRIENGGDVAALKGTVVHVIAHLSAKTKAAHIVLSDGTRIPMSPDFENMAENEFRVVGSFTVKAAGTYKIELTSDGGERYNGSNEYDITLLEDAPPTVVIEKPGRDMKVTNIQEIFTEARAEDDYGVASIEFFYQVNGGEEKHISLQDLKRDEPKTLSGSYTFFLEEMKLQVGDFLSYYAKAKDNNGQESTSDIYFLEVRPFDREFRQSQQQGGQGSGDQDSNALTRKQREIIAATFRVQREEKTYDAHEKDENFGAVALSQEKLQTEAEALVERIKRRMGAQLQTNQQFSKLVEYVSQAAKEMDGAKDKLREKNTKEALPPEQRSLQNLLKAEALFREIQISQSQGQGGGQQGQDQKELADLFELQLDKMKNQYETVQRQQQSQQSQQQDDIARRLEELARRQQKELEQRMRSQMQGGGGGNSSQRQQQQMIDEAQRMARELEKLSRDRRDPKMQEAAQQLQQAAEDLKRAQSQSSQSQSGQADASAQMQRALQRIEQARQMLNSSRQTNGQQNVQGLRQRAEDALKKQGEIEKNLDDLAKSGQGASGEKKQQLADRKQALADQIAGLEQDIDQTARGMGSDKQQAADKLREAANAIRRNRIGDRIKQNNELINRGFLDQAKDREHIIKGNIEEVVKNLQAAEGNANQRKGEGLEDAMNRARELADNLESLRRRMESQQGNQQNGQQGKQGQQANQQSGQQGGQQAQANQQGQNGRQRGNQQGGQQQGNQQSRNQQGGQPGQQNGQQQGGQPGQSARGQQQGKQQGGQQPGGQQSGQQASGQQQSGQQQGGQQAGQQGQQGSQQGGQQGSRQQGGRPNGGERNGRSEQAGMQGAFVGGGGGPPRSGDRQTDSEIGQRLKDAEELRRMLGNNKDLTRTLDDAVNNLRRIDPNAFSDPAQLALLKSEVIDPLRQLEVELARRLQAKLGNTGTGALTEGDAPDRYRKMIEDYYRRLSSRSPGGQK